jgi:hypothetical protein
MRLPTKHKTNHHMIEAFPRTPWLILHHLFAAPVTGIFLSKKFKFCNLFTYRSHLYNTMADKSSETDKEPRTPSATAETDPESRPPSPFPDPFDLAIPRGFDSFADGNGNRYLVPPYLNGPTEQLVQRHIAAVKDWKDIPHTKVSCLQ